MNSKGQQILNAVVSQYCPASPSSQSITCYDKCCCYDITYNLPYCCDCTTFSIIFYILILLAVVVFIVAVICVIRRFMIGRRNIRLNTAGYHPFNVQPVYQPNTLIYQPSTNPNNLPINSPPINNPYQHQYQYGNNVSQPYQGQPQPNTYFQQKKESIYMGEPVNESDNSSKNQRVYAIE